MTDAPRWGLTLPFAGVPLAATEPLVRQAEDGLALARFMFTGYATVPVYEAFFRGLGWGDAIDPMLEAWRAGARKRAVALAPEALLREIFVFGGPGAMRERLAAFAAAGVTTLCLMPICDRDELPAFIDGMAP